MNKEKPIQGILYYIMKLTLIQAFVMTIFTSLVSAGDINGQGILDQQVALDVKNSSIRSILSEIEKQTSFNFTYNSNAVKVGEKVSFSSQNLTVKEIIDSLFGGSIQYFVSNKDIILSPKSPSDTFEKMRGDEVQNNFQVAGLVTDETGLPLPGVNVLIKGTTTGTTTDVNGKFALEANDGTGVLTFSFIGYATQEIAIDNRTTINIALQIDTKTLGEVVVVGYGSQVSREVTGAIQQINADDLKDLPVAQMTQKMQGRFAGVQINQATGKPGLGMKVRIRGQASISTNSDPLYVVDGFPIVGDINNINPDEIETITVLKDAASTSLYGSRASNGLVMITTKRAKVGKTTVDVSASYGVQKVPQKGRPEMMNGTEFAQFKKESYEDLGQPVPVEFQNPSQYGEGYDWYDVMLRTAPIQNYSVALSSGNEKFKTSAIAGFFNQDGVLLNSNFKRFSLRLNTDIKISEKVNVGLNLAPTYTIDSSPATDGAFYAGWLHDRKGGLLMNAMLTWPIIPYENADGTLPLTATMPGGFGSFANPNWYRAIQEITNENNNNRLLSNAFISYEPLKGLMLKSSLSVDLAQSKSEMFKPSTASIQFTDLPPVSATALRTNGDYLSWLNENIATYKTTFNTDHNLEVLAGFTSQRYRKDHSQIGLTNFPDDRIGTVQTALDIVRGQTKDEIQEWALLSYLSRLSYNYKGKYLFSASIRRDGSSRFGSDNKWGNFPSVSAGWIVSDENFLANVPVSFLKLRASYGMTGNNSIGNYTQYANVNTSDNAVFGSTVASGAAVTGLANPILGWESTAQLDLGIDVGVLNDRISFSYDYYTKWTKDLLYAVNVNQESGFNEFTANVGEVKFWGHEITLSTRNTSGKLKWNTDFNISFNRNKVIALVDGVDRIYGKWPNVPSPLTTVGQPLGQFYGAVFDGVYVDQADLDSSPKAAWSEVGVAKFKDVNGDGIITIGGENDDRTIIGNPFPKFIFGMNNTFQYKNIDLSIFMSGSVGNDIMRNIDQGITNLDGVFNVVKDVKDRWRSPENPGKGKYGTTTRQTWAERDNFSSRFVHKGDYLAIKNITLGYKIPLGSSNTIKSLRIYGSIQQALVFTGYAGNPEVSVGIQDDVSETAVISPGFDFGSYPVPRTFNFGLNFGL